MKKKSLLVTIILLLIAVFAFSLTACDKGRGTLESLKNEYGIALDGGSFEEGSTLISSEIVATTEEGIEVLRAIADQNYNKDGNVYIFDICVTKDGKEVQPNGKVKVSIPVPDVQLDSYLVFHIKNDNSVEKLATAVADGRISFEISSFSYFVIAEAAHEAPECNEHRYGTDGKCTVCGTECVHIEIVDAAVAPTCTATGKTEGKHCSVCNTVIVAQEVVDALGHTEVIDAAVAPTCTATGKTEGKHCSVCNTVIVAQEVVDALGHTEVIDAAVAPTCTTSGKTEGKHCSVCNEVIVAQEEVPAKGHTAGEVKKENIVGSGCESEGSYDAVIYCTVCGTEISRENINVAVIGHSEVIDAAVAATCTEPGKTEGKHCSVCNKVTVAQEEVPALGHAYVWVEGKISTCKEEGIVPHYNCEVCGKNFNENYGEIDSVALPIGSHKYGSMYWGKSANFWEDGNIEYYRCETCEKYFDNEYSEVETPVIPKYSTNLSICVNGVPTALVLGEQHENFIEWSLEGLSVTKGDVITICQTDNREFVHNYFAEGNVGTDGKILTTATAANVTLTATPNGLMLFIDGYKYEGIVIEINGVQYPMIYTSYPDETTTYIYGYVNFAVGDKFVIVDNISGTVYDYDELDEEYLWDTWDFHRGDNGEFVIDYACRYGIEFDYVGNKKIYINKIFAPFDGGSYELTFDTNDLKSEELMQMQIETGSEAYEDLMWYYDHEDVVNKEDIVSYIKAKGIYVYIVKLQLEEGTKFNIKNLTANSTINAEHLVEVYTESGSITKDGNYVKVLKSGYYSIVYIPCFNSFMVEEMETPADVYMYLDGEFVPLLKDTDGIVTYEGLAVDTNTNILFTDNTYTTYLPITLDSQTNTSIAHVFEYSGMSMLYFDKAGTYNLSYNVETGVLSITSIGGDDDQGGGTGADPSVTYSYVLSVVDSTNGNQGKTLTVDSVNPNEYSYKGIVISANSYITVTAGGSDGSYATYYTLSDTDASVATTISTLIMLKKSGTFDIYFNTQTKTVRVVYIGEVNTAAALPKDIYISTMEKYTFVENSENSDELCYLGLVLEGYDDFRIRDTDNNYISDITLASGTTGVQTSGSSIMVEAGGTYNIYINKTTHVVRIIATS